ncbi:4-phosphopantetheinyl transferase (plasmid) [Azospirillum sp. TSH58]|uniref:4'-phosphopantetheinyl transferase family protein n=1 Tax=Azospirillum sp. TSH58 TaxID=664962 RepID=UPI000D5FF1E0|nr:4'-phosphopantetheinyl transferase superfamily protein [Azospirillum sp. TSH58]AWJ86972.1 4-phosphopantetheinyl transferase [Azospirillum sp. TSH58]PWC68077.1 4-phosphopantetheinyl transferase [Azospirillum sp. TSH58]
MRETGEIQLCYADLRGLAHRLEAFRALLSPDEAARAARFATEELRARCALRRGLLRHLLGRVLGRDPATLAFAYGPMGKPSLPGGPAFNLADCKDHVLIAIAPSAAPHETVELGVDVERLRSVPDAAGIAERFFAPEERAAFAALPDALRDEAFLNGWTRKEAFIKATGQGLSTPLDRFAVELVPGRPARLLGLDGALAAGTAADWSLFDLRPAPGLVGALAVRGDGWRPVFHPLDEAFSA